MRLTNLFEDNESTAVFAFGRFNPPTKGHEKLLNIVRDMARQVDGKAYVFVSQTQDKKNPLSQKEKIDFIKSTGKFSDMEFGYSDVKTIVQALQKMMYEGRTKIIMVAGSDRQDYFMDFLTKYNKQKDKEGNTVFDFDTVEVASSGERDPDSDGVAGFSATQARQYAADDDYESFKKVVMDAPEDQIKKAFNTIKTKVGKKVALNNNQLYNEDENMKPVVYLDMDGVIVDFFGGVAQFFGVNHWKELRQPGDGTDFRPDVMDKLKGSNFFATLPKFPTADHLVQIIKDFSPEGYTILSSPLRGDHENSAYHKKIWLKNNLSVKPNDVIITGRKQKYAVQKDGTPNILIDDKPSNIENWRAKGGYAIQYQANQDTLDVVKRGLAEYDSRRNS